MLPRSEQANVYSIRWDPITQYFREHNKPWAVGPWALKRRMLANWGIRCEASMLLTDVSGCSPVVKGGQVQQVGTVRVSGEAFCSIAMHVPFWSNWFSWCAWEK